MLADGVVVGRIFNAAASPVAVGNDSFVVGDLSESVEASVTFWAIRALKVRLIS